MHAAHEPRHCQTSTLHASSTRTQTRPARRGRGAEADRRAWRCPRSGLPSGHPRAPLAPAAPQCGTCELLIRFFTARDVIARGQRHAVTATRSSNGTEASAWCRHLGATACDAGTQIVRFRAANVLKRASDSRRGRRQHCGVFVDTRSCFNRSEGRCTLVSSARRARPRTAGHLMFAASLELRKARARDLVTAVRRSRCA